MCLITRLCWGLFSSLLIAAPLWAQAPATLDPGTLQARYPAGVIQSTAMADQALREVSQVRIAIETQYTSAEHECYPKFFTTNCLQQVSERRRRDLATIRAIEVQANSFKRQARVNERDEALVVQAAAQEAEVKRRIELQAQKASTEGTAGMAGPTQADRMAEEKKRAENIRAYKKKQDEAQKRLLERDNKIRAAQQPAQ